MAGKKDVTAYKRPHKLKYGKWGLIFILPFFICYGIFQLYPLIATFYRSFFHDKTDIFLNSVFEFAGFENYIDLFTKYDIVKYFGNTMLLWLLGFIPQIIVSLLFASWFTDIRLKLKGTGAVKVILYLPNMLMASSIAVLFGKLFAVTGPINHILGTSIHFLENEWGIRLIIAFINFLMWTGRYDNRWLHAVAILFFLLFICRNQDTGTRTISINSTSFTSASPCLNIQRIYQLLTYIVRQIDR